MSDLCKINKLHFYYTEPIQNGTGIIETLDFQINRPKCCISAIG